MVEIWLLNVKAVATGPYQADHPDKMKRKTRLHFEFCAYERLDWSRIQCERVTQSGNNNTGLGAHMCALRGLHG